jgi:hypothetical protein
VAISLSSRPESPKEEPAVQVTFAHLCDYASISREGKLSVMGIFTTIHTAVFPSIHPMLYVVFEIELSPAELNKEIRARVELADADGNELAKAEATFAVGGKAVPGERPTIPYVVPIGGLPLQKAGRYQWSIWLNENHQRDVPFEVRPAPQPPPAA